MSSWTLILIYGSNFFVVRTHTFDAVTWSSSLLGLTHLMQLC